MGQVWLLNPPPPGPKIAKDNVFTCENLLFIVFLVVLMSPVWWGLHDTLVPLYSTYGSPGPPKNENKEIHTLILIQKSSDFFHILNFVERIALVWNLFLSPAGAVGPGTGDIATPPVRPSVCLSVRLLYAIFNIKKNIVTYWLNWRWFLQIVDGDSGNLYIQYNPLFPCSDFWSQTYQMWGWFGGGGG